MPANVGILGLGVYLPPTIRTNDWWPKEVVARWQKDIEDSITGRERPPLESLTETQRVLAEALAAESSNPFRGVKQRHGPRAGIDSPPRWKSRRLGPRCRTRRCEPTRSTLCSVLHRYQTT